MTRYYATIRLEVRADNLESAKALVDVLAAEVALDHDVIEAYQDEDPEEAVL